MTHAFSHSGFPPERNTSADLLYTFTEAQDDMQLFWWVYYI